MLRAIAAPSGDRQCLDRLLAAYTSEWQATVARLRAGGDSRPAALAAAASGLQTRSSDPLFMAWIHRLQPTRGEMQAEASDPGAPLCSHHLPRLGRGGLLRLRLSDCPELARLLAAPERESSLADDAIGRELTAAIDLLDDIWPEAAQDIATFARALLVLESSPGSYNSGSDADLPFTLAVTCAAGAWPVLLAESMVHETAHVKLRIAMRVGCFFEDDDAPRFRHPWRSDARPLRGVVLAAHAFLSIFTFYVRLVDRGANKEAARKEARKLRDELATALDTLAGAKGLTGLGQRLTGCMASQYEDGCRRLHSRG